LIVAPDALAFSSRASTSSTVMQVSQLPFRALAKPPTGRCRRTMAFYLDPSSPTRRRLGSVHVFHHFTRHVERPPQRLHPGTRVSNRFGNSGIEVRPIEQIETL
jgi:hypothetical protein